MPPEPSLTIDRESQLLSWQGWSLTIPKAWNPVKIEGDHAKGSLLLADMYSARLGIRWRKMSARDDPVESTQRLIANEVGNLAASESVNFILPDAAAWSASRLYVDRDPPGRDVWVGQSRRSGRTIQIVHHSTSRAAAAAREAILRSVTDADPDSPQRWALFDFSLVCPAGRSLRWYRFNAGDYTFAFADGQKRVTILRQIRPATLALARLSLKDWIDQQQESVKRLYRTVESTEPVSAIVDGESIEGIGGVLRRRRRLWWLWMTPREQNVLVFHDEKRNRLLIGQGFDKNLIVQLIATIG